jgi:uncharacterized phage-associated protein
MARVSIANQDVPGDFDSEKTLAAAIYILHSLGPIKYIHLLKLLYLSDREAWRSLGRSITGDEYVAMKKGPVLSRTYDEIKALRDRGTGMLVNAMRLLGDHRLEATVEPNLGVLSIAERRIVDQVLTEHGKTDPFELSEMTHKLCPEWTDPGNGQEPITRTKILEKLGYSETDIAAIKKDRQEDSVLLRAFATR